MGRVPNLPLALAPARAALSSTCTSTTSASLQITHHHLRSSRRHSLQQLRHANFIRRPRHPYVFTQLVQLTDGSSYTVRTTSPQPIYRASKDARNTLLWQPNEKTLKNVEADEAGRLAAFRDRFGRAFDAAPGPASADGAAEDEDEESFADLISGYATQDSASLGGPKESSKPKKK